MRKFLVLLAAIILALPIFGCGAKEEDTGPIQINGKTPDADKPGDNREAGGADMANPL